MSSPFTFEQAVGLAQPTKDFKCKLKDNIFALQFLHYEVKDMETKQLFYQHHQEPLPNEELLINDDDYDEETLKIFDGMRMITYTFSKNFLSTKAISSALRFKVGEMPVKDMCIVDHFFFKGKLIKSFKFNFPFCAPNSTNEWEYVYDFPNLTDEVKAQMVAQPGETKSETFFFVDKKIVLHNKAEYRFV